MELHSGAGRKILKIGLWAASAAWLAFCFFLSWQSGGDTAGLSWSIAEFLTGLLRSLGISVQTELFHTHLRLFAHFGIFFVAGLLLASALEVTLPWSRSRELRSFLIAGLVCTLSAVLAEVGKLAVPGRHLTWSETALNAAGAVSASALIPAIAALMTRRRKNQQ